MSQWRGLGDCPLGVARAPGEPEAVWREARSRVRRPCKVVDLAFHEEATVDQVAYIAFNIPFSYEAHQFNKWQRDPHDKASVASVLFDVNLANSDLLTHEHN